MRFRILAVLTLFMVLAGTSGADSLWKSTDGSFFTDKKAHKVGDSITILVIESSSASQKANTSVSKKSDLDVSPGIGPILKKLPQFGFEGSSSSTANGSTSRSAALTARITATVTEVLPNGNLAIIGTRSVKANDETQILKISGIVRPEDVTPDNTVQSTYVADAKIEYTGRGPIAERQKPGIITRIFKLIF